MNAPQLFVSLSDQLREEYFLKILGLQLFTSEDLWAEKFYDLNNTRFVVRRSEKGFSLNTHSYDQKDNLHFSFSEMYEFDMRGKFIEGRATSTCDLSNTYILDDFSGQNPNLSPQDADRRLQEIFNGVESMQAVESQRM